MTATASSDAIAKQNGTTRTENHDCSIGILKGKIKGAEAVNSSKTHRKSRKSLRGELSATNKHEKIDTINLVSDKKKLGHETEKLQIEDQQEATVVSLATPFAAST